MFRPFSPVSPPFGSILIKFRLPLIQISLTGDADRRYGCARRRFPFGKRSYPFPSRLASFFPVELCKKLGLSPLIGLLKRARARVTLNAASFINLSLLSSQKETRVSSFSTPQLLQPDSPANTDSLV